MYGKNVSLLNIPWKREERLVTCHSIKLYSLVMASVIPPFERLAKPSVETLVVYVEG